MNFELAIRIAKGLTVSRIRDRLFQFTVGFLAAFCFLGMPLANAQDDPASTACARPAASLTGEQLQRLNQLTASEVGYDQPLSSVVTEALGLTRGGASVTIRVLKVGNPDGSIYFSYAPWPSSDLMLLRRINADTTSFNFLVGPNMAPLIGVTGFPDGSIGPISLDDAECMLRDHYRIWDNVLGRTPAQ